MNVVFHQHFSTYLCGIAAERTRPQLISNSYGKWHRSPAHRRVRRQPHLKYHVARARLDADFAPCVCVMGRDDRQFKAEPLFRGIVPRRLGRGDRIRISSSLLDCPNFAATCHGIHNRLSDFSQANAIDARVNQATEINCCANGFDALEVGWAHPRCDFGNISLRPQRIGRSSLNADVVDKVF